MTVTIKGTQQVNWNTQTILSIVPIILFLYSSNCKALKQTQVHKSNLSWDSVENLNKSSLELACYMLPNNGLHIN